MALRPTSAPPTFGGTVRHCSGISITDEDRGRRARRGGCAVLGSGARVRQRPAASGSGGRGAVLAKCDSGGSSSGDAGRNTGTHAQVAAGDVTNVIHPGTWQRFVALLPCEWQMTGTRGMERARGAEWNGRAFADGTGGRVHLTRGTRAPRPAAQPDATVPAGRSPVRHPPPWLSRASRSGRAGRERSGIADRQVDR